MTSKRPSTCGRGRRGPQATVAESLVRAVRSPDRRVRLAAVDAVFRLRPRNRDDDEQQTCKDDAFHGFSPSHRSGIHACRKAPRVFRQMRTSISMTGTSMSTPTTVASAAPEDKPKSMTAVAMATSK